MLLNSFDKISPSIYQSALLLLTIESLKGSGQLKLTTWAESQLTVLGIDKIFKFNSAEIDNHGCTISAISKASSPNEKYYAFEAKDHLIAFTLDSGFIAISQAKQPIMLEVQEASSLYACPDEELLKASELIANFDTSAIDGDTIIRKYGELTAQITKGHTYQFYHDISHLFSLAIDHPDCCDDLKARLTPITVESLLNDEAWFYQAIIADPYLKNRHLTFEVGSSDSEDTTFVTIEHGNQHGQFRIHFNGQTLLVHSSTSIMPLPTIIPNDELYNLLYESNDTGLSDQGHQKNYAYALDQILKSGKIVSTSVVRELSFDLRYWDYAPVIPLMINSPNLNPLLVDYATCSEDTQTVVWNIEQLLLDTRLRSGCDMLLIKHLIDEDIPINLWIEEFLANGVEKWTYELMTEFSVNFLSAKIAETLSQSISEFNGNFQSINPEPTYVENNQFTL